ncbi:hypothetical protein LWI29_036558 [Acer saccharum]|uniref:Uncharacterized protein n=1 Tax=Acer saccharum TaxID=4024 RepID=A0AA39SKC7_ACESA|nr:hypothetical protein LWI29_036558 [Acer saccharum]
MFGAWLKVGIPIIRPPTQGRVSLRQSSASLAGSPCVKIKPASGLSHPGSSTGKESQVVVKESGSGGNTTGTDMEGVGKGKGKIDGIMIADSRVVNSNSHDGRQSNVIGENAGVATNKLIFEFSSQRSKAQVLNDSIVKTTLSMIELGRKDAAGGPRPYAGKDLHSGRWKRVGHKSKVGSNESDGGCRLGKRESPTSDRHQVSNKKSRGVSQQSSDVLVDVEVCGHYDFIQEERLSKSSLALVVSDGACVGESGVGGAELVPDGTTWPQVCGGVVTSEGSTVGIEQLSSVRISDETEISTSQFLSTGRMQ